jgi:hypothetical protein
MHGSEIVQVGKGVLIKLGSVWDQWNSKKLE